MNHAFNMSIRSLQDAAPLNSNQAHALLDQLLSRSVIDPMPLDADGIMLYGDPVSIVETRPAQEQSYLPPEMMVALPTMIGPQQAYYMAAKLYYFAITGNVCLEETIMSFPAEPAMQDALRMMTDVNPDARLLGVQAARQAMGSTADNPFQNMGRPMNAPVPMPAVSRPVNAPMPLPQVSKQVNASAPMPQGSKPVPVPVPMPQPMTSSVAMQHDGRLYWLCIQEGDDLVPLMELSRGINGGMHAEINPGSSCTLMAVSTNQAQSDIQVHQTMNVKLPMPFPGGKAYLRLSQGRLDVEVRDLRTGSPVAKETFNLRQEVPA